MLALRAALAALLALLFGRLWRRGAPSPDATAVDRAWVERCLRRSGAISAATRVKAVETQDLAGNRGLGGAMSRLLVTYQGGAGPGPASVLLKHSRARRSCIAAGHAREAQFYSSQWAVAGRLPAVYAARGSALLGEFHVLMEDLDCSGSESVSLLLGNQCWPMPRVPRPPRDAATLLTAVFLAAAEMHAAHWCSPALLRDARLKGVDWFDGTGRRNWERIMRRAADAWAGPVRARADVQLSPRLVALADRSFAAASWPRFVRHLQSGDAPFTLCHGDFHAGNMSLLDGAPPHADARALAEQLRWFDWSEVGPMEPATELAQFVISDLNRDLFGTVVPPAVRAYHARLGELGVAWPFEECWAAFVRGGLEKWIWLLAVVGSIPAIPARGTQYFHDQMLAFVETFGTEEVLGPAGEEVVKLGPVAW